MQIAMIVLMVITACAAPAAATELAETKGGRWVETPYREQNVLFDFYFDEPEKINSALYWIRSQMNPLMDEPYNLSLIHISEPTRRRDSSRMPSSA